MLVGKRGGTKIVVFLILIALAVIGGLWYGNQQGWVDIQLFDNTQDILDQFSNAESWKNAGIISGILFLVFLLLLGKESIKNNMFNWILGLILIVGGGIGGAILLEGQSLLNWPFLDWLLFAGTGSFSYIALANILIITLFLHLASSHIGILKTLFRNAHGNLNIVMLLVMLGISIFAAYQFGNNGLWTHESVIWVEEIFFGSRGGDIPIIDNTGTYTSDGETRYGIFWPKTIPGVDLPPLITLIIGYVVISAFLQFGGDYAPKLGKMNNYLAFGIAGVLANKGETATVFLWLAWMAVLFIIYGKIRTIAFFQEAGSLRSHFPFPLALAITDTIFGVLNPFPAGPPLFGGGLFGRLFIIAFLGLLWSFLAGNFGSFFKSISNWYLCADCGTRCEKGGDQFCCPVCSAACASCGSTCVWTIKTRTYIEEGKLGKIEKEEKTKVFECTNEQCVARENEKKCGGSCEHIGGFNIITRYAGIKLGVKINQRSAKKRRGQERTRVDAAEHEAGEGSAREGNPPVARPRGGEEEIKHLIAEWERYNNELRTKNLTPEERTRRERIMRDIETKVRELQGG